MKELTLQASVDNLRDLRIFVDSFLNPLSCPEEDRYRLCLVVDELFTNIASYAYGPEGGSATIRLGYDEASGSVLVTMIDRGIPFNPLEKEDPDISGPIGERRIGGLGIFILKQTMDRISYCYTDGQNILSFSKNIRTD